MTALRISDSMQNILLHPRHPASGRPNPSAAAPFASRFPAFSKKLLMTTAPLSCLVQLQIYYIKLLIFVKPFFTSALHHPERCAQLSLDESEFLVHYIM